MVCGLAGQLAVRVGTGTAKLKYQCFLESVRTILFLQQEPQTTLSFRNPKHGALHHRSAIYRSHRLVLRSFSSFLKLFTIKP